MSSNRPPPPPPAPGPPPPPQNNKNVTGLNPPAPVSAPVSASTSAPPPLAAPPPLTASTQKASSYKNPRAGRPPNVADPNYVPPASSSESYVDLSELARTDLNDSHLKEKKKGNDSRVPLEMSAMVRVTGGLEESKVKSPKQLLADPCVVVKVLFAGMTVSDVKVSEGAGRQLLGKLSSRVSSSLLGQEDIPGCEFCGIVVKRFGIRNQFRVGDVVFGISSHTYAQYAVAPTHQVAVVTDPDSSEVSLAEFAALPVAGLTAMQALNDNLSEVGGGATNLLVLGGTTVDGQTILQVAQAMADTHSSQLNLCAIGSSKSEENQLTELGATHVFVASGSDQELMTKLVEHKEQSGPFQLVLDCRSTTSKQSDQSANFETAFLEQGLLIGTYVNIGQKKGFKEFTLPFVQRVKCCSKPANTEGDAGEESSSSSAQNIAIKSQQAKLTKCTKELQQLAQWAQQGKIKPLVSEQLDFHPSSIQQGLDQLATGNLTTKLVIQIQHEHEQHHHPSTDSQKQSFDQATDDEFDDEDSTMGGQQHQHHQHQHQQQQHAALTPTDSLAMASVDSHTINNNAMTHAMNHPHHPAGLHSAVTGDYYPPPNNPETANYIYPTTTTTTTTLPTTATPATTLLHTNSYNNGAGVAPPLVAPPAYVATLPAAMHKPGSIAPGANNQQFIQNIESNFVPIQTPFRNNTPSTTTTTTTTTNNHNNNTMANGAYTAVVLDPETQRKLNAMNPPKTTTTTTTQPTTTTKLQPSSPLLVTPDLSQRLANLQKK